MTWEVRGTTGRAVAVAFAVPHLENRLVVTRGGHTTEETLGDQTSYAYQLAALDATRWTGCDFATDLGDAVATRR